LHISNCRVCKSDDLESIFKLPDLPLVGDFKVDQNIVDPKFPLDLLFCSGCKVLQVGYDISLKRLFTNYSFSSSTIQSLVEHFNKYANWLVGNFKPMSVLEVGCNDGVLLDPLKKLGVKVFGVDMSVNIGALAQEKNLDVKVLKFGLSELQNLKDWVGSVDLITASNAFPHNEDPGGFLSTARDLLTPEGFLVLEVMYAGSLKQNLQWDSVYHEHLHIHSLHSLKNLFQINGYSLIDAEIVDMHAGTLRVVAKPGDHKIRSRAMQILNKEDLLGINTVESWLEFGTESHRIINKCHKTLSEFSKKGTIWAYGASGRASMWLNAANLHFIEKIVDSSYLRAGRFIPGVSTPIVLPKEFDYEKPRYVFITAWNYSDKIMSQHPKYDGKWIIPLPKFRIIEEQVL
jgi:2-polyprenyl-3-methyl-5-hydroxy-6-metoxy-1,4-benzoquinol methylase